MRLWRISNYADLSGQGGLFTAARWNRLDTPIVYCADHPASALLEILVNSNPENWPSSFQLLQIEMPDDVEIAEPDLPPDWRDNLEVTRNIGTGFVFQRLAAIMRVPSAIMPFCYNYLVNPDLADAAGIRIAAVTRHPIDARLVGSK
jgi:RES domain-containing protein